MSKSYYISDCGDKKLIVKRNKKKIPIHYQSREAFLNNPAHFICGYTDLKKRVKKRRKNTGTLFSSGAEISPVYPDRGNMKVIKGYIDVGDDNFIAIERKHPMILILPLFSVLLLLLFLSGNFPYSPTDKPWIPDIDPGIHDTLPDEDTDSRGKSIIINGFTDWSLPAGETENLPILLENPKGNPCYFTFSIILSDGAVLYESKQIPPGNRIGFITINQSLTEGKYAAELVIRTNDVETGAPMNSAKSKITIHSVNESR